MCLVWRFVIRVFGVAFCRSGAWCDVLPSVRLVGVLPFVRLMLRVAVRLFGVAFCRLCVWRGVLPFVCLVGVLPFGCLVWCFVVLPFVCLVWRFVIRVFGVTVLCRGRIYPSRGMHVRQFGDG